MAFLLFVFLSYIVNRILNNLTLVICLVFAFEEFAIKLHSLFVKTPSLWIALLGHIHPLLSRSKSSTSSFVQNKCLHLTNQFLKRLCLHVSNISFYKARKSKILQQRDQIRGCKKGGLAAGIWNQIWSWSWRALWLVWVYKPKILQNIKSGQQLHNSIGLFHYSLNELLDDSSQS